MRPTERPVIGFLTDFGLDGAAATCRAVMLSICRDAQIVDIGHTVRKYAIRDGAFLLRFSLPYFPVGVHVGVVDPGVGTARRPVGIRTGRGDVLIGPDNGLLVPAAEALGGIAEARELVNRELWLPATTSTFHGRDIFAPVAAHLAAGDAPFEQVGPVVANDELVRLPEPGAVAADGAIETVVTYVDSFGNIRLAGGPDELARRLRRDHRRDAAGRRVRRTGAGARNHPLRHDLRRRPARRIAGVHRLARQPGDGRQPGQPRVAPGYRPRPGRPDQPGLRHVDALHHLPHRLRRHGPGHLPRRDLVDPARRPVINDLTHGSRQFGIRDGAFLLWSSVPYQPVGVHLAVVDPGVGTERRPLALRAARGDLLVGPDNGLLLPAAERLGGITAAHALDNRALWRAEDVSSTFHGRDIFAPVAAHLASGVPIAEVGHAGRPGRSRSARLPGAARRRPAPSTPASCSSMPSGTAASPASPRTSPRSAAASSPGDAFTVLAGDARITVPWQTTFGARRAGGALLYDDADYAGLAIGVNQGSAAERFGLVHETRRSSRTGLTRWPSRR